MKKLILSLAAVAALGTGAAFAQDAECQAGSAWGAKPGCGHAGDAPLIYNNGYGNVYGNVYGNSGWPPANSNGTVNPFGYALPGILAQAFPLTQNGQSVYVDPATGIAYPRTTRRNWDRDGDGVPNNRDRYPDDPRYR